MTTATRWSFSAGIRYENRVRLYEAASGLIFIEYREETEGGGKAKRVRQSLGHRDRTKGGAAGEGDRRGRHSPGGP